MNDDDDDEYVIYRSPLIGLVCMDAEGYANWWRRNTDDRDKYPMVSRGHTREEAVQLVAMAREDTDE